MDFAALKNIPTTPAFVLHKAEITRSLEILNTVREESGCKILYSVKALPFSAVLDWTIPYVDGFSVSSLFEARLAAERLAGRGCIHLTTPGLNTGDMRELGVLCTHVNFNSLNQYQRLAPLLPSSCAAGLRVNPKLSFLSDDRFNPCRMHSKLGVDIAELQTLGIPEGVTGLQVHNIFSSSSLQPLQLTVAHLCEWLRTHLQRVNWINLGGGYLFNRIGEARELTELLCEIQRNYAMEIFIEPGKAIVGDAGFLVATVIDSFVSDGKNVAVMDSSVNHHPELFEYQRSAEIAEPEAGQGDYSVILAGCTCLAGDLFGDYRLREPLKIGDRVVFKNLGAYSLIKASRFNGYNFPDIYAYEPGRLKLLKRYTYSDYRSQWLANSIE